MSEQTHDDNRMELAIDSTKNFNIKRPLNLFEFIDYVQPNAGQYVIDKFYANLLNDTPIYVDRSIMRWLGYDNKNSLSDFLESNFADYKDRNWLVLSHKEYEKYYVKKSHIKTYPNPATFNKDHHNVHIIINTYAFKRIIIALKNKDNIDQYEALEDLIKKYTDYKFELLKAENMSLKQKVDNHSNNRSLKLFIDVF